MFVCSAPSPGFPSRLFLAIKEKAVRSLQLARHKLVRPDQGGKIQTPENSVQEAFDGGNEKDTGVGLEMCNKTKRKLLFPNDVYTAGLRFQGGFYLLSFLESSKQMSEKL